VIAYLIDAILLLVAFIAIRSVLGPPIEQPFDIPTEFAFLALDGAMRLAYQVGLWTGGRSTVGMRILGIRVVSAVDDGPLPVVAGLRRWMVLEGVILLLSAVGLVAIALAFETADGVLSLVTIGWTLLLLVTMVTDERSQGLHDRIARTYVVRR
jgi:uncharacterized RDD family membrane protein YckC